MDAATTQRLRLGAQGLGVSLDDDMVLRLQRYFDLLLEWNAKINLTAIKAPDEIVDRHFLDSLAVVPLVRHATTLLDVGSGAGFPGAVISVALPSIGVTCVDATHKKVAFLETLKRELAPSLNPLCARDDKLRADQLQYEVVISRATWDPQEWLERGAPLVKPDGLLLAMLTEDRGELVPPPGFSAERPHIYEIAGVRRRLQSFQRGFHVEPPAQGST